MLCKTCGKEVDDNAVVCPHCGCALNETPAETPAEAPAQATAIKPAKKSAFAILGFICSLISLVYNGYFIFTILGLVLSIIGVIDCKKNNKLKKGRAVSGIVLAAIMIVIELGFFFMTGGVIFFWQYKQALLASIFKFIL